MAKKTRKQTPNRPRNSNVKNAEPQTSNLHFELRRISPLTTNQQHTFESYENGKNLVLHGAAGSGKTFISMYLALKQILTEESIYDKIVLIRSVVPSRDMGFLPGSMKEKIAVYEEPYKEICDTLFGRGDGYEILKLKKIVNFTSTSFLRGVTFNNAIVILDEAQNLCDAETNTVMTRLGDNSRVVICGDFKQTDLLGRYEKEGITKLMAITKRIPSFDHIEFGIEDIVRGGIVKSWIIAKEELGL